MFTTGSGLRELRADSAIYPGELRLCATTSRQQKGVILDTSVRTPTCPSYLTSGRCNATNTDGFAAAAGEADKDSHHRGRFAAARWELVPMVQESFGRMGRRAAEFVKELATHSAACKGGSMGQIARRSGHISAAIRTELSTSLAKGVAQRVFAYVRGAYMKGRSSCPVSKLLA
jgi:hypothetical protein